ncbi:cytochrome c [Roseovarius sp.]|uniref:c-type cytochrome n=1 Tax=Roseovarius sp. TaxID=1486281 RepID=UPI002607BFA3|nr:cytochrome c [Roseovarius sp.]
MNKICGSCPCGPIPDRPIPRVTIGKFEERAPAGPPRSSAAKVGDIDPAKAHFGVGQPATDMQIAGFNIDAMPDGRGLPPGQGSYAEGEEVYAERCAACHGADLEGNKDIGAPKLIGGRGTLTDAKPVKTVESYWPHASTLFDYVHRAMPMDSPGSLSADEVYAVSAYILGRADIISDDPGTTLDAESMAKVEMPNADGFVSDPRPDVRNKE